jgi:pSer/pThr/pTyr-binding forkhead associated (FHA) protein
MSKKLFVRIGSNPTNDLVIDGIDSFHMELFRDTEGNVFISDLNTQSGTRVNSRKLDDYIQLNENDKVYLAETILFDWKKILKQFDGKDSSTNQSKQTPKAEPKVARDKQKSVKRDYMEIALIYGAILAMIFLISLWF